jgi:hypothetical protein
MNLSRKWIGKPENRDYRQNAEKCKASGTPGAVPVLVRFTLVGGQRGLGKLKTNERQS